MTGVVAFAGRRAARGGCRALQGLGPVNLQEMGKNLTEKQVAYHYGKLSMSNGLL